MRMLDELLSDRASCNKLDLKGGASCLDEGHGANSQMLSEVPTSVEDPVEKELE